MELQAVRPALRPQPVRGLDALPPPQPHSHIRLQRHGQILSSNRNFIPYSYTGFAFRIEHRKWNRGRNGLHQLGQPSLLRPLFYFLCSILKANPVHFWSKVVSSLSRTLSEIYFRRVPPEWKPAQRVYFRAFFVLFAPLLLLRGFLVLVRLVVGFLTHADFVAYRKVQG